MISKSQVRKILFIKENILEKYLFVEILFEQLDEYLKKEISKREFNQWLNSWEAAAELDQDRDAASRIKKAVQEIKLGKTPHKTWEEFKQYLLEEISHL